ncbi:MAG: ACT domain-containing protein [Coriobacteriia bacterium]
MIEQLSVFLENKTGRLAEMTRILGDAGFNMRALVVADTAEFGVARVIVDRPQAAKRALEEAGFSASITGMLAVQVPDRPGGLADVLERLGEADVNVEYAYAVVPPGGDSAVGVFRVEDVDAAVMALQDTQFGIVGPDALYEAG